jgi:TNF receptor-associated protein 1
MLRTTGRLLRRTVAKTGRTFASRDLPCLISSQNKIFRLFSADNSGEKRPTSADEIVIEPEAEVKRSDTKTYEFQAETRKLLQIVAKSIYTDSEVFVRELLSNCSDALEKEKYRQLQSGDNGEGDPLQVSVVTNESKRQISFFDTGIGMSKEELIQNLGTIARSGSKNFIEEIKDSGKTGNQPDIIGQFGVGFYSSFIVGHSVEVISKRKGEDAFVWVSDGSGQFSISKAENVNFERGTKITIHLTSDNLQFSRKLDVETIIKKYSNFINYPIFLNGEKVNMTAPVWCRDKQSVQESEYRALWEHISKTKLPYKFKLHYSAEVPIQVKAVLFIPASHAEKMGLGREEGIVSLYSRKVLIKEKCTELLPTYLRFVRGVVDCEDLPLNISRENYQDSQLIARLRSLITKRVLKLLSDEMTRDPANFDSWAREFSPFLGEGMISDKENAEQIVKLLRFKSTASESVSIDDYISSMKQGQTNIYYTVAADTKEASKSPFMEPFLKSKTPVLLLPSKIEEFFFLQMEKYKGFKYVSQ